jgi:hypothetical protein
MNTTPQLPSLQLVNALITNKRMKLVWDKQINEWVVTTQKLEEGQILVLDKGSVETARFFHKSPSRVLESLQREAVDFIAIWSV